MTRENILDIIRNNSKHPNCAVTIIEAVDKFLSSTPAGEDVEGLAEDILEKNVGEIPIYNKGVYGSVITAMVEMHKAALQNKVPVEGLRWVKASERLPEDEGVVFIKTMSNKNKGYYSDEEGKFYYMSDGNWTPFDESDGDWKSKVEWLDETLTTIK